jgi:phage protein D
MAYLNAFDGIDIQLVINGHLYKPDDIGLFRLLVAFEDDGDSGVELHCDDHEYFVADSVDFQPGSVLSVKWGYKLSKDYSEEYGGFVIQKPSVEYGEDGVVSIIKAYTKSGLLSALKPQKVYNNKKLGDIVKDIASRAQMKVVWNSEGAGQELVPSIAHATWSDRQLLSVLADRFGYQVSYLADTLVFDRITYAETPAHRLLYNSGEEGNIKSATVSMDSKKDAGTAMASAVNSVDKAPVEREAGKAETALGVSAVDGSSALVTKLTGQQPVNAPEPKMGVMDSTLLKLTGGTLKPQTDLNSLLGQGGAEAEAFRTILSQPATQQAISDSHATAFKFNTSKKKCGLELVCIGIPSLKMRQLVEVIGLAKRDSGNWYVSKAVHRLEKAGYTLALECNRSHSNSGQNRDDVNVNTKNATANSEVGPFMEEKVKVSAVNGDVATVLREKK